MTPNTQYIRKQGQKQNYDGEYDGGGGGNDYSANAAADNASYYQQNDDGTY